MNQTLRLATGFVVLAWVLFFAFQLVPWVMPEPWLRAIHRDYATSVEPLVCVVVMASAIAGLVESSRAAHDPALVRGHGRRAVFVMSIVVMPLSLLSTALFILGTAMAGLR